MKKKLIILLSFAIVSSAFSQTLQLDFPKLGGETAWIYTFTGSRADSFSVVLNDAGKAAVSIPQKDYRGMAYFYIPKRGGGEMIIAENTLHVTSSQEHFNAMTLEFPHSVENAYLRRIFQRYSYLSNRQDWLKAGEVFFKNEEDKALFASFSDLLQKNNEALLQLTDSIKSSSLYAARFMELRHYMQRLYAAQQQPADTAEMRKLKNEMQYLADINALYHAGNLWTDIQTYYPGLFAGTDSDSVQKAYAASIGTTMLRLKEPVLTAFLSTALTVSERTGSQKAQEMMLHGFLRTYPLMPVSDPKIKRMLGAFALNEGSRAPLLAGLEKPLSQPAVLIFMETDCDHCRRELEWVVEHYQEITAKGYRVVSVASDMIPGNYQKASVHFAWDKADQLCDFKGFEGENFRNYGIVGTPTVFVLDGAGVIQGKYARVQDALPDIQ